MLDAEIRTAVEARLRSLHGPEPQTRYRHELGLCSGETRVDVAAINGQITGCEIKSARDKLTRLPRQVELYGKVLDVAVLVVEGKHRQPAADLVPDWWGVWYAEEVDGLATLREVRVAGVNLDVEPFAVAQMLWRDEALAELKERGLARGLSSKARWYVWDRLAQEVPLPQLKAVVRRRLKARREW